MKADERLARKLFDALMPEWKRLRPELTTFKWEELAEHRRVGWRLVARYILKNYRRKEAK